MGQAEILRGRAMGQWANQGNGQSGKSRMEGSPATIGPHPHPNRPHLCEVGAREGEREVLRPRQRSAVRRRVVVEGGGSYQEDALALKVPASALGNVGHVACEGRVGACSQLQMGGRKMCCNTSFFLLFLFGHILT